MDFYTHGGNIYDCNLGTQMPILDFSANINPLGLPEQVKQAVINSLDVCVHYPDPYCRELTTAFIKSLPYLPRSYHMRQWRGRLNHTICIGFKSLNKHCYWRLLFQSMSMR